MQRCTETVGDNWGLEEKCMPLSQEHCVLSGNMADKGRGVIPAISHSVSASTYSHLCQILNAFSPASLFLQKARSHEQNIQSGDVSLPVSWKLFWENKVCVLSARWNSDRRVVSSLADTFISFWCFHLFIYFKGTPFSPGHLKYKTIIKSVWKLQIRDVSQEVGWHFRSLKVLAQLPFQPANLDSSGHLIKQQSISKYQKSLLLDQTALTARAETENDERGGSLLVQNMSLGTI